MTGIARWIGGAIATALVAAGSLSPVIAGGEPTKPDPDNASLVARGKALYADHCARCHGANLEGQQDWRKRLPNGRLRAPPHDVTGHTWHHSDQQLFEMTKNGTAALMPGLETDMPAYKDILSDAEIWDVLSFIESTWPPNIRQRQDSLNRTPQ